MERDYCAPVVVTVANAEGKRTAREVEVLLSASYADDPADFPTRFRDEPLPWIGGGPSRRMDVPPGVERRAIVLYAGHARGLYRAALPNSPVGFDAISAEYRDKFLACVGAFPGYPRVVGDIHWIEPDIRFSLTITVTAADIDATIFEAEVALSLRHGAVFAESAEPPARMTRE